MNRGIALALLASMISADAHAAAAPVHTMNMVIYDPNTGQVLQIIIPTSDAELNDKSLPPPGTEKVLVPVATYNNYVSPIQIAKAAATDWMARGTGQVPKWVTDVLAAVVTPPVVIQPLPPIDPGIC